MAKKRAPATVNRYLAQLRHMINWAIDRGLLERTPFLDRGRGVRLLREDNQRYRRLEADEETRLLSAAADESMMTERLIVALDTGMRRGEMLQVQNKHILWSEDLIRIIAANTKSAESPSPPRDCAQSWKSVDSSGRRPTSWATSSGSDGLSSGVPGYGCWPRPTSQTVLEV